LFGDVVKLQALAQVDIGRSSRRQDFSFQGWCEFCGPGSKTLVYLDSYGGMMLRQPLELLMPGLHAGLFLNLRCGCLYLSRLGLRVGLGLRALFFLFLTIRFYGPPAGLFLILAGFTEPA
jgi:hypothetical protein